MAIGRRQKKLFAVGAAYKKIFACENFKPPVKKNNGPSLINQENYCLLPGWTVQRMSTYWAGATKTNNNKKNNYYLPVLHLTENFILVISPIHPLLLRIPIIIITNDNNIMF